MKACLASKTQIFSRRQELLPVAALGLALSGLTSLKAAVTCSYGEIFDFSSTTAQLPALVGTMTNLDIDRLPASVSVTNSNGGNLPAGISGNGYSTFTASTSEFFFPGFSATTTPNYGKMISCSGGLGETPLTFTFSKSMRNLTMNFNGGDNKIFAFTDASGNPVPFTIRSTVGSSAGSLARSMVDPPTGDGSASFYVKQLSTNSIAIGEGGQACIQFTSSVSVLKMTQTYARTTLGAGMNYNTTSTGFNMNFGQYCDQPGVVDMCNAPHPTQWFTANTTTQLADGRVLDETGKAVTVQYQGGLSTSAVQQWTGFMNGGAGGAEDGNYLFPVRPTMDAIQMSFANPSGTGGQVKWVFGESVKNPVLALRGSYGGVPVGSPVTLKFYKADGVTPLPFLPRDSSSPDFNRQIEANVLYAQGNYGNLFQFIGETDAIVMKTSGGANPFTAIGSIIMNCKGTLTPSGSAIDLDTDGDGVPDITDKCPNTPAGAVVGSDGCPLPTDLSIVKTASVTKITPGVPFTYTITVTNTGAQATNVKASDIVPSGLTINSATASDSGVVTQNGQSVEALWSIVPNGGTRTLTINVTKP